MAINPETQYPGKINPSDADYPYGSARNITTPGDGTGTPWEAALVKDMMGLQQGLLVDAGIVPSSAPDTVGESQYLQSINQGRILNSPTLADALARKNVRAGMAVLISGYETAYDGGAAHWDYYPAATFTVGPTIYDVFDHDTLPLQLKLRIEPHTTVAAFGANNSRADNYPYINANLVRSRETGRNTLLGPNQLQYATGLVLQDGDNLIGQNQGEQPLGSGATQGTLLAYTGTGVGVTATGSLINVEGFDLRDVGNNAVGGLQFVSTGGVGCESCRCDVLIHGFTSGFGFKLFADDGGIAYGDFKVRVRDAKTFFQIEDNNTGIPAPFGFVNSNRLTLVGSGGAVGPAAYDYGLRVIGGNDNTIMPASVIEPFETKFGHVVVDRGTINGQLRVEGSQQPDSVPLVNIADGSESRLEFFPSTAQVVNRSRRAVLKNRSPKSLQPRQDARNRFLNPTFTSVDSSGALTDWSVTGAGVTYTLEPSEIEPGYSVLKLTVPAGVLCEVTPAVPQSLTDIEYDFVSFGAWMKYDEATYPGGSAKATLLAPAGLTSSAEHLGDGLWTFIGMSQAFQKIANFQSDFLFVGGSGATVFEITAPTFAFGQVMPERNSSLSEAGGKVYGRFSESLDFVDLAVAHGGANELTLPDSANTFLVTSTTTAKTIARINNAAGRLPLGTVIRLMFDSGSAGSTISVGAFIKGRANVVTDADSVVEMVSDAPGVWRITSVY